MENSGDHGQQHGGKVDGPRRGRGFYFPSGKNPSQGQRCRSGKVEQGEGGDSELLLQRDWPSSFMILILM